jgi:hypothetical protein
MEREIDNIINSVFMMDRFPSLEKLIYGSPFMKFINRVFNKQGLRISIVIERK